jgi:hypothetical protein
MPVKTGAQYDAITITAQTEAAVCWCVDHKLMLHRGGSRATNAQMNPSGCSPFLKLRKNKQSATSSAGRKIQ